MPRILVIVVTHNSELFIKKCTDSLSNQSAAYKLMIVDAGSSDLEYLVNLKEGENRHIVYQKNIGFAAANNHGYSIADKGSDYVLFLNPDAFLLDREILKNAIIYLDQERNSGVGCITFPLLGYNMKSDEPTGLYDSFGIKRRWFGGFEDFKQGKKIKEESHRRELTPDAICGAFMFCRRKALINVEEKGRIFDERFFMYKEDLDLSLRLKKREWGLRVLGDGVVYHCRGWKRNQRKDQSQAMKLLSAKNDVYLNLKHKSPYLIYSLIKFFLVKLCKV